MATYTVEYSTSDSILREAKIDEDTLYNLDSRFSRATTIHRITLNE